MTAHDDLTEELTCLRQEVVVLCEAIDELRELLSFAVNIGRLTLVEDVPSPPAQVLEKSEARSSLDELSTPQRPMTEDIPDVSADRMLFYP